MGFGERIAPKAKDGLAPVGFTKEMAVSQRLLFLASYVFRGNVIAKCGRVGGQGQRGHRHGGQPGSPVTSLRAFSEGAAAYSGRVSGRGRQGHTSASE